jgi:hypothetical protein
MEGMAAVSTFNWHAELEPLYRLQMAHCRCQADKIKRPYGSVCTYTSQKQALQA